MVLPPPPGARKVRKQLSADALFALLGQSFARIPDHRQIKPPIPLRDALLSAFAMFALKDPSLLAFDQRRSDANLKALFGIGQIPSDTQTREILDPVDPEHLRPGRARWHIENETFNTLKNQGYHYEHNYGHGQQNLSVVFAMLMMLAFLVDQTQQLCCGLFRAVWQKLGSKRALWEILRSHFYHFTFRSMRQLYEAMLYDLAKGGAASHLG